MINLVSVLINIFAVLLLNGCCIVMDGLFLECVLPLSSSTLQAFEAYDICKDRRAVDCLKYMCLSKVLGNHASEVSSILSGKVS